MVLEHHLPYIGDTFHTLIAFILVSCTKDDDGEKDGDELMSCTGIDI